MPTILDEIIQKIRQDESHKWQTFDKERVLHEHKKNRKNKRVPTHLIVDTHNTYALKLVAEIKQASPSQGIISKNFHPKDLAKQYLKAGADAISVLTEQNYFKGSLADLSSVRGEVSIPLLRKDFIVDCYQVDQAYIHGADIVLLIVAVLDDRVLRTLYDYISGFGMQVLIEVHTKQELERVLSVFSTTELIHARALLGINNRDLHTFSVDLQTTESIAKHIPTGIAIVSESGIFNKQDASRVKHAGVHAILVGQGILQHESIDTVIGELTG